MEGARWPRPPKSPWGRLGVLAVLLLLVNLQVTPAAAATYELTELWRETLTGAEITIVAISSTSDYVAAGTDGNVLYLFTKSGVEAWNTSLGSFTTDPVNGTEFVDGSHLLAFSNSTLHLYGTDGSTTGIFTNATDPMPILAAKASITGGMVAFITPTYLYIYNLTTGGLLGAYQPHAGTTYKWRDLAAKADGSYVYGLTSSGAIEAYFIQGVTVPAIAGSSYLDIPFYVSTSPGSLGGTVDGVNINRTIQNGTIFGAYPNTTPFEMCYALTPLGCDPAAVVPFWVENNSYSTTKFNLWVRFQQHANALNHLYLIINTSRITANQPLSNIFSTFPRFADDFANPTASLNKTNWNMSEVKSKGVGRVYQFGGVLNFASAADNGGVPFTEQKIDWTGDPFNTTVYSNILGTIPGALYIFQIGLKNNQSDGYSVDSDWSAGGRAWAQGFMQSITNGHSYAGGNLANYDVPGDGNAYPPVLIGAWGNATYQMAEALSTMTKWITPGTIAWNPAYPAPHFYIGTFTGAGYGPSPANLTIDSVFAAYNDRMSTYEARDLLQGTTAGTPQRVDFMANYTSTKTGLTNAQNMDLDVTEKWFSISATGTWYAQQIDGAYTFGTTYSYVSGSGAPTARTAISGAGSFSVEGRGAGIFDVIRLDGTRVGTYTAGGLMNSVAISDNGLWSIAGSSDGIFYVFGKQSSSSWQLIDSSTPESEVKAVAFSPDGAYGVAGRSNGVLSFYQVGETTTGGFYQLMHFVKDGSPATGYMVKVEDGGITGASWTIIVPASLTDSNGDLTFAATSGRYYRITVDGQVSTISASTSYPTLYLNWASPPAYPEFGSGFNVTNGTIDTFYRDPLTVPITVEIKNTDTRALAFCQTVTTNDLALSWSPPAGTHHYQVRISAARPMGAVGGQYYPTTGTGTTMELIPVQGAALQILLMIFLMVVAGLFGYVHAPVGALAVSFIAAWFNYENWLTIPWYWVQLALLVSFMAMIARGSDV